MGYYFLSVLICHLTIFPIVFRILLHSEALYIYSQPYTVQTPHVTGDCKYYWHDILASPAHFQAKLIVTYGV